MADKLGPAAGQVLLDIIQLVILVGGGLGVAALDKYLGLVNDRHGHLHLAARLIHREVLVAGDIPLVRVLPVVAVIAVAVDVQLHPVLEDVDLLAVEVEEEAVALGQAFRLGVGFHGVGVAVQHVVQVLFFAVYHGVNLTGGHDFSLGQVGGVPDHPHRVEDIFVLLHGLMEGLDAAPPGADAVLPSLRAGPAIVVDVFPGPHGDEQLQMSANVASELLGVSKILLEAVLNPLPSAGGGEGRAKVQRPLQKQRDSRDEGQSPQNRFTFFPFYIQCPTPPLNSLAHED